MFTTQRIRDPIHNLIVFQAREFENTMWKVIETRPFQRLRRIKQLGFSDFVYPGATHSRFAHSIGVFHTARQLMQIIQVGLGTEKYEESRAREALAAALVHDIGHGPFSHAFEEVGRRLGLGMANHEMVSDALIRDGEVAESLNILGSGFANDVANIIRASGPGNIYSAVVSSQFDADRLDYIRRDRLMTGTQLGGIDFEWLISNIEIGKVSSGVDEAPIGELETFVLGPKAVYAAEAFVLSLFQLYPTVYLHKTTRGAEKIFIELLVRIFSLIQDGSLTSTGLPGRHPLARFAKKPSHIDSILPLDDTVIAGALTLLADAKDSAIRDFALRLRERKLYKCIDIRQRVSRELNLDDSAISMKAVDRVCAVVKEKVDDWLSCNGADIPRILPDEAVREPYKQVQESKGPLNQIRIKTPTGELVDLGKRSEVVAAIQPFKLYRVYLRENDNKARQFIDETLMKEVRNAAPS